MILICRWLPQSLACYASLAWKAFPLDMSQYYRLFNSTRLPVLGGVDELKTYDSSAGHVLVLHNGHMYTLQAVQDNGERLCTYLSHHDICMPQVCQCLLALYITNCKEF